MHLVYFDESGDISFALNSPYRYLVLTALIIEENDREKLSATLKRKKGALYKIGWPRNIEIKGATLHNLKRDKKLKAQLSKEIDGDLIIKQFLESFVQSPCPRIDYLVLNKTRVTSEYLRTAEYGISYNFFSGRLLIPIAKELKECRIFADPRNKETHSKRAFRQYLETEVLKISIDDKVELSCKIEQPPSHENHGLQAVDLFSWAIHRRFAANDHRFINLLWKCIKGRQEWYCA
jgi:hypothetical protein